ncbi:MAG: hypothetical protein JRG97_04505 [Deltaproteobacteria bacterium]|nr:hypothetical protein [Deltaproteobacteria bacterium]MBW2051252.1 hypothetical protein [Deltaproteobacteria bacterium]MBW2140320.1 hypothetical protein [Deltaproteobacteria bacterium]MBW2323554.1 hypothetical protein [Deltaproteobacteria bacterium]
MDYVKGISINTCLGERQVDTGVSPVGVARMDVDSLYADSASLLMDYINNSNQEAWEKIKAKIGYTFENLDLNLLRPMNSGFNQN